MSEENFDSKNFKTATFGTGCFWCTEAIFQQFDGVIKVASGYSGGHVTNPTYEAVCNKITGHAECLNIEYDKTKITFDELLQATPPCSQPEVRDRTKRCNHEQTEDKSDDRLRTTRAVLHRIPHAGWREV